MKYYLTIGDCHHIARTNIAGCQTECGLTLQKGMSLFESPPPGGGVCQRCSESTTFTGHGPMSLPHYLESQNAELRQLVEDTATTLESHNLHRSAASLREKLHEVTCNER